ncbi:hypothetical protein MJT46_009727 [Ovis ammon polii x Ovis aries]|nr:hypothetical protein MJT46_009727 [Ovis ammon polii x Ovis aries]
MERKRGTTHSERMDRKPNTENENSRTRRRTSSRNRLSAGEDKSRRNTGKSATQGRKNVTYSPIRLLNLFLCPRSKQDSDDVLSKCVIIQGKTIFLLLSKELSRRISTTQKDGTLTGMKSASDPSVVPLGVDTETIWYIKPSETKLMGNWSFMHQKTALIPDNIE